MEFADLINQLADHIGEKIPQRANLPKHQVSESKDIQIYQMNSGNPELIIYIGIIEPFLTDAINAGLSFNLKSCLIQYKLTFSFIIIYFLIL